METNYFKIIFNYINGLRKYRWFHIAICIEFVFLVIALLIHIALSENIDELSLMVSMTFIEYTILSLYIVLALACLFILFLLIRIIFKNINKTRSKFLLYSPIYTPFFFIGILGIIFSIFGVILFIKLSYP